MSEQAQPSYKERMKRLSLEPPRCPLCDAGLPGILTQTDLATFPIVRCYNDHKWMRRGDLLLYGR